MTMILSRKRDAFAVLSADRLVATRQAPCGELTKLVRHPRLPLAFAVGGMMHFYLAPRSASAADHVAEFAATITAEQLVVRDIARRLEERFQAAMTMEAERLQLFIALVKDGAADVGVQIVSSPTITDDPTRFIPGDDYYVIPECVQEFYRSGPHLGAMRDLGSLRRRRSAGWPVRPSWRGSCRKPRCTRIGKTESSVAVPTWPSSPRTEHPSFPECQADASSRLAADPSPHEASASPPHLSFCLLILRPLGRASAELGFELEEG